MNKLTTKLLVILTIFALANFANAATKNINKPVIEREEIPPNLSVDNLLVKSNMVVKGHSALGSNGGIDMRLTKVPPVIYGRDNLTNNEMWVNCVLSLSEYWDGSYTADDINNWYISGANFWTYIDPKNTFTYNFGGRDYYYPYFYGMNNGIYNVSSNSLTYISAQQYAVADYALGSTEKEVALSASVLKMTSGGVIDTAIGIEVENGSGFGGIINNSYALRINSYWGLGYGGKVTNLYGIYIDSQAGGKNNSYNLFSAGENSLNKFEGFVEGKYKSADGSLGLTTNVTFTPNAPVTFVIKNGIIVSVSQ